MKKIAGRMSTSNKNISIEVVPIVMIGRGVRAGTKIVRRIPDDDVEQYELEWGMPDLDRTQFEEYKKLVELALDMADKEMKELETDGPPDPVIEKLKRIKAKKAENESDKPNVNGQDAGSLAGDAG